MRALAGLGPVDLVYGAFGGAEPDPAYEAIENLALHRISRPSPLRRLPAYARARAAGVPEQFARGIWPGIASRAVALADTGGARLIADGPIAAAGLLPRLGGRDAVYSAHNLESAFRHRLEDEQLSQRGLRRFERDLLERFPESWMVSPADLAGAAELAPGAKLRLVPNVVDVAAIEPLPPRSGQRRALFLANFDYEPNAEAFGFLRDEVMPALWGRDPEFRLAVAGKGSDLLAGGEGPIDLLGFADDLRQLYDSAGCVVVPLLEGGGSPLKFVEALAFAIPVVATPKAAAGLEAQAGVHFAEAAGGADFAAAMLAVVDPEVGMPLARAGRELAEREYSIESLRERLAP
ncbi:MAG: glycosyltransferase [Solirubrobacterales bacterium]